MGLRTSGSGSSPSAASFRSRAHQERGRRSERRSRPEQVPAEPGPSTPPSGDPTHASLSIYVREVFRRATADREEVEHALARDPRAWLPGLAAERIIVGRYSSQRSASGSGSGSRERRPSNSVNRFGQHPRPCSPCDGPLRCFSLFPSLDADLEVAPLSRGTQLAMSARYEPPFGGLGRTIDRAVLSGSPRQR